MADAESKKAPRLSSGPPKATRSSPNDAGDGLETLEVLETTSTAVRSLGPPPRPSARPHKGDAAPHEGLSATEPKLEAPEPPSLAIGTPRSMSGPPPLPTPSPPVARSRAPEPKTMDSEHFATHAADKPVLGETADTAAPASTRAPDVPPAAPVAPVPKAPRAPESQTGSPTEAAHPTAQVSSDIQQLLGEITKLKGDAQKSSFTRSAIPYAVLAILSGTLGYLLGDSIESRKRADIRKVAMDRYYTVGARPADEQKEALGYIQKYLTQDDAELARWAKSQVAVIDERIATTAEREAGLKVRMSDLKGELDQKITEALQLAAEKARLEARVAALESVDKKLDRLKQTSVLLIQAKVGIERLSRQLNDIEESPDAQTVSQGR